MNILNAIPRPTPIDYAKIASAIEFYKGRGFEYIDVPWAVTETAMNVTKPANSDSFVFDGFTDLVASAEQSFIQLMIDDKLPKGRYCAVTPCFRDEHNLSDSTRKCFLKVELIDSFDTSFFNLKRTVSIASSFFKLYIKDVEIVKTEIGFDIVSNGLELGSYGMRKFLDEHEWIYGTGCAEPRLSIAQKL